MIRLIDMSEALMKLDKVIEFLEIQGQPRMRTGKSVYLYVSREEGDICRVHLSEPYSENEVFDDDDEEKEKEGKVCNIAKLIDIYPGWNFSWDIDLYWLREVIEGWGREFALVAEGYVLVKRREGQYRHMLLGETAQMAHKAISGWINWAEEHCLWEEG